MGNEYSYETQADGKTQEEGSGAEAVAKEAEKAVRKENKEEEAPPSAEASADPDSAAANTSTNPPDSKDEEGGGDEDAVNDDPKEKDTESQAATDGGGEKPADTSTDLGTSERNDEEDTRAVEAATAAAGDDDDVKESERKQVEGTEMVEAKAESPKTADVEAKDEKDESDNDVATEKATPSANATSNNVEEEDEEVIRARALAQFIEKYGANLTPEQIANITPEQIERLTHVGSKIAAATPPPRQLRPVPPRPMVELREYELHPMYAHSYLHHTAAKADLRKSLSPLRLFAIPETGGQLNVATHLYHWRGGYSERNARKVDMAANEEWKEYIKKVQPALASQKSTIFMEAPFVYELGDRRVIGLGMGRAESTLHMGGRYSKDAVYEVCRYKLKLGYDIIPQFLKLYEKGLPSKLDAEGGDPSTNLITLMYSTVGTLNEIVEIWRHGGGYDAMERSGAAAQQAKEWRESGVAISDLTTEVTRSIIKPISFSPLQ